MFKTPDFIEFQDIFCERIYHFFVFSKKHAQILFLTCFSLCTTEVNNNLLKRSKE